MNTATPPTAIADSAARLAALARHTGRLKDAPPPDFAPWPVFDQEQIDAVTAVLQSGRVNYWTGEEVRRFEEEFAAYCGTRHAIAVANGTVALELALVALGIGPGDEVIVTPRTFIASASAVALRGAVPVFVEVDAASQNITADTIRPHITPRTRAILCVHLAGWPCEMSDIMALARRHNLAVIEDCAQAHGAEYRGRRSGALGDIAAFSFCQDKIMTTGGEGGMLTTNDPQLWRRAWSYKDHGKDWDRVHAREPQRVFRWLHRSLGTNWRMTEMQAAIGRVQLRRLPEWLRRRRQLAAILNEHIGQQPGLRIAQPPPHVAHAYYKYYAFLTEDVLASGWARDEIVRALQSLGVPCGSGVCPAVYLEDAFAAAGIGPAVPLPVTEQLGRTSLMLLVHPTLNVRSVRYAAQALCAVVQTALDHPRHRVRAA